MQSFPHLNSFKIYNIILFIVFCIIVNPRSDFVNFYVSIYCIFHFLLIYIGVYHYRKILYFLFFLYGLGLDLLLINEVGPHLLVFMTTLYVLQISLKYLYNLKNFQIYLFLLFSQLSLIFIETLLLYIFFNVDLNTRYLIQIIILSLILSYPIFLLFSKIDKMN